MNKFLLELEDFYQRESKNLDEKQRKLFKGIVDRVIDLYLRQLLKSNHTMMELVLALNLIKENKEIEIEKEINNLTVDLIVYYENKKEIIEVETGFVPPEYSTDPVTYRYAREISKIARYSKYADIFSLAIPPFHLLQIPEIFALDPDGRREEYMKNIKDVLDRYYKAPPITLEELRNAKINYIYIIHVDKVSIKKLEFKEYLNYIKEMRKELF
ncbi:MAG: hypothetical protein ACO2OV_09105 [Thermoproteota archaeon]|jgi:hypothetical protein